LISIVGKLPSTSYTFGSSSSAVSSSYNFFSSPAFSAILLWIESRILAFTALFGSLSYFFSNSSFFFFASMSRIA
jgi:hypothetical protein